MLTTKTAINWLASLGFKLSNFDQEILKNRGFYQTFTLTRTDLSCDLYIRCKDGMIQFIDIVFFDEQTTDHDWDLYSCVLQESLSEQESLDLIGKRLILSIKSYIEALKERVNQDLKDEDKLSSAVS